MPYSISSSKNKRISIVNKVMVNKVVIERVTINRNGLTETWR